MATAIPTPTDALCLNDRFGDGYRFVDFDADRLTETEKRTFRARTQPMLVVPRVDPDGECIGMYDVFTGSGSWYVVDLVGGGRRMCDCPDAEHTAPEKGCKHYRRVKLGIDETALPAPSDSAEGYWDWLFEQIRVVTDMFPAALDGDENLETMVQRAMRKAREEQKAMPSAAAPEAE